MWMTIFMLAMAIAVICVAVNQIIMNFTVKGLRRQCQEAEKKLTGLEGRIQSQPLEIISALYGQRCKQMSKTNYPHRGWTKGDEESEKE